MVNGHEQWQPGTCYLVEMLLQLPTDLIDVTSFASLGFMDVSWHEQAVHQTVILLPQQLPRPRPIPKLPRPICH